MIQREGGACNINSILDLHRLAVRTHCARQRTVFHGHLCFIGHGKEDVLRLFPCFGQRSQRKTAQVKGDFLSADFNIFCPVFQQNDGISVNCCGINCFLNAPVLYAALDFRYYTFGKYRHG